MASDLSQLPAVDELSISRNCKERYDRNEIYTACGRLLIALNPYKQLPIYGEEAIRRYHTAASASELGPHVYAVAAAAYRGMLQEGKNQSVIISGESGAGKTESAKHFLEYMAQAGKGAGSLHAKVLQTNPVLEAFGNARTVLNDNSSRFGKFLTLEFTATGKLAGAKLKTYLLEKTRVTGQAEGERNYHVFYYLAQGGSREARSAASLSGAAGNRYLGDAAGAKADSGAHGKRFQDVSDALAGLGIAGEQAKHLWGVVGAVVHAGNLAFKPKGEELVIADNRPLHTLVKQLGLEAVQAEEALVTRKIKVGAEVIAKPNTEAEAESVRDALAKALFSAAFDWLVRQLNKALRGAGGEEKAARFIGAVDVFGFEIFPHNSLEQLCINYANERLQRLFVGAVFESQLRVYKEEGVRVEDIPFTDNTQVVRLIDTAPPGDPGLLQLLGEECVLGNSSDESFLAKMNERYAGPKAAGPYKRSKEPGAFAIAHFAGEVTYEVKGFVAKNKDPLPVDLSMLLKVSSNDLVAQLFNPPDPEPAPGGAGPSAGRKAFKSAKFVGVIDAFRVSLNDLVATLDKTHTHFVRCIKPNMTKAPEAYDEGTAVRQLRTSGVVQAVHAARAGFPDHVPFNTLVASFAEPGPKGARPRQGKGGAEEVLKKAGVPSDKYRMGHNLAFLAVGVLDSLEAARMRRVEQRAVFLQARARGVLARRLLARLRDQKVKQAAEAERKQAEAARKAAEEAERRRAAEEAEREKREAAQAKADQEEAARKQQKFNIARQKSFERTQARKKRAEGAPAADGGAGPSAGPSVRSMAAAFEEGGGKGGPPKAVVTDEGWKNAAASGPGDNDMAAAEAAQAAHGFSNPLADVYEYAEYLGMDVQADKELLWIADEALSAPEPHGWEQRLDPKGNVYYLHENTGTVLSEHPLDHHYQQLYYQLKDKATRRRSTTERVSAEQVDPAAAEAALSQPLHIDLGSLPASVLLSKETLQPASLKELWGGLTTRKTSRTHNLQLVTYEHTVTVKRPKNSGLGVGLTVDNVIVEMDPGGAFAQAGDDLQPYDKIVAIDGVPLGGRMLKDVVKPKPEHRVTVMFAREQSLPKTGRDQRATVSRAPPAPAMRLKEYSLTVKRHNGSPGFTLDPTNVIIALEPDSDAASILQPGDKVVEVDGVLLEKVRFAERADSSRPAHKLRVCRLKPPKGLPPDLPPPGPPSSRRDQQNRIQFREVTLSKQRPEDRIGVLFHKTDDQFDTSAFQSVGPDAALPIIKRVDPDTVGARAGLEPGDVVLAVNGLSGMSNYQVVEMIRTLAGEITFLVAPAPKRGGA